MLATFNFGIFAIVTIECESGAVVCSCLCSCETHHSQREEAVFAQSEGNPSGGRVCTPVVHDPALNVFTSEAFPCVFTRSAADMFLNRRYSNHENP